MSIFSSFPLAFMHFSIHSALRLAFVPLGILLNDLTLFPCSKFDELGFRYKLIDDFHALIASLCRSLVDVSRSLDKVGVERGSE